MVHFQLKMCIQNEKVSLAGSLNKLLVSFNLTFESAHHKIPQRHTKVISSPPINNF